METLTAPLTQIIDRLSPKRTIYIHGPRMDSCEVCGEDLTEDNPGKEWVYHNLNQKFIVQVCNGCIEDPEYQQLMKSKNPESVTNIYNPL